MGLAIADDDRVAGYITAVSDGVLSAYIPQLEVLASYRGRGIGSELVRRMVARLADFYTVDLLCDPELFGFYGRFGFRPTQGMLIRRYDKQSGVVPVLAPDSPDGGAR